MHDLFAANSCESMKEFRSLIFFNFFLISNQLQYFPVPIHSTVGLIQSIVWEAFYTECVFHKKYSRFAHVLNRLQSVKDSGGRIAHIHISETVSNAHIVGFAFVMLHSKLNH